ncbi:MAG TPA: hypothetical protein VES38_04850 [Methylotenera sp.]|nr:hypothetical protein [Methylotenera sp.]
MNNAIKLSEHLDSVLRQMTNENAKQTSPMAKVILSHYGFVRLKEGQGWFITNLGKHYLEATDKNFFPSNLTIIE